MGSTSTSTNPYCRLRGTPYGVRSYGVAKAELAEGAGTCLAATARNEPASIGQPTGNNLKEGEVAATLIENARLGAGTEYRPLTLLSRLRAGQPRTQDLPEHHAAVKCRSEMLP